MDRNEAKVRGIELGRLEAHLRDIKEVYGITETGQWMLKTDEVRDELSSRLDRELRTFHLDTKDLPKHIRADRRKVFHHAYNEGMVSWRP